ncbi:Putative exporter of polyketide antibiotics-like protein [Parafrankia sp. EAN1pec]|uniref:exporter of polyketide antibiotics-like protein n=1 Tax=Parafrankia sp. (strain EAN1pec) TaxID=298653 RepID=UPI0000542A2C|nr:Putative exporter of polyketide antibiotics-like protein [Frankia sp. EAN1pec]
MRGEEESRRWELLLTGQTTPRRAAGQAVAGLRVGLAVLLALTTLGMVVSGRSTTADFSLGQCVALAATVVAGAAMFLAVGALASQLAATRRQAATIAAAVLGVGYALRMAANTDRGVHWLGWLSPLGWVDRIRPLTDPNPVALVPVLALTAGATAAAVWLAGRRDAGTAILPGRHAAETFAPHERRGPGPYREQVRKAGHVTVLIVAESCFGNTTAVAHAVAAGLTRTVPLETGQRRPPCRGSRDPARRRSAPAGRRPDPRFLTSPAAEP